MKTLTSWRHPRCTLENRVVSFVEETKSIENRPQPSLEPRPRLEPSADPGSGSAGLPAPDRSRYKEDLQWIPAPSEASFRVFGRWQDGNHIAVGQLDDLLRWLLEAVAAFSCSVCRTQTCFCCSSETPPVVIWNLQPAAVEGAARPGDKQVFI